MDSLIAQNQLPYPIDEKDQLIVNFGTEVMQCLAYEPNESQVTLMAAFAHFLFYGDPRSVFLLNGYAEIGRAHV